MSEPTAEPRPRWLAGVAVALSLHALIVGLMALTLHQLPRSDLAAADQFPITMVPARRHNPAVEQVAEAAQAKPSEAPQIKLPFKAPPQTALPPTAAIVIPPSSEEVFTPQVDALPLPSVPPPSPDVPVMADPRIASAALSGVASEAWLAQVLAQLERNKHYPAKARYFRQQDRVLVRFTIDRRGRLLSANIVKSQGYPDIDAEVLALLKRAQPLVPPPPEVVGEEITETVTIEFYLG